MVSLVTFSSYSLIWYTVLSLKRYSSLKDIIPLILTSRIKSFTFYLTWMGFIKITLLLFLTITPLFNYFLWQTLELNILNLSYNLNALITLLSFLLLHLFTYNSYFLIYLIPTIILSTLYGSLVIPLTLLLVRTYNIHSFIHTPLVIIILFNLLSYTIDLTLSISPLKTLNLFSTYNSMSLSYTSYSCSNFIIVTSNSILNTTDINLKPYNFFYKSNILRINNVNLIITNSLIINLYKISDIFNTDLIFFELSSLEPFLTLSLLWVLFLSLTLNNLWQTITPYN